jgi:hypothetical protein
MAKSRTLNQIRQSKEYQRALDIQTEKVQNNRTHPCSESTAKAIAEHQLEFKGENFYRNPFNNSDVDLDVEIIVENLKNEIYDLIFQAVCDEMNDHPAFDSSEYLTEAGLELFEDEWFEFYHEHHGNIIHQVIQSLK